jgi:probable FeS assembly SUF system protein SufT
MPTLVSLNKKWIPISRPINTILVPDGDEKELPEGTELMVVHHQGGDYTLRSRLGRLYRVEGIDGDALGLEAAPAAGIEFKGPLSLDIIHDILRTCYDPEIPVNLLDMGLIYDASFKQEDDKYDIDITMTLTAPGCGMGQVLVNDVQKKLARLGMVRNVNVNLVFDPAWNPSMMTEAARLQAGLM